MSQQETQVGGIVLIVELRPYNPIVFMREEQKRYYGETVRIATLARYLCEAWQWTSPDSDKPEDRILRPSDREDVFFRPGQDIELRYVAGGDEMEYTASEPEYVWLEPSLSQAPRLGFCSWLRNVRSTWAGWTVGTQLAFLNDEYPFLVKEVGTYAFPTMSCSKELADKINADRVALIEQGSMTIGVARFDKVPIGGGISFGDQSLVAAGLYFLGMEQRLQKATVEMAQQAASVTRDFHPRSKKR